MSHLAPQNLILSWDSAAKTQNRQSSPVRRAENPKPSLETQVIRNAAALKGAQSTPVNNYVTDSIWARDIYQPAAAQQLEFRLEAVDESTAQAACAIATAARAGAGAVEAAAAEACPGAAAACAGLVAGWSMCVLDESRWRRQRMPSLQQHEHEDGGADERGGPGRGSRSSAEARRGQLLGQRRRRAWRASKKASVRRIIILNSL